MPDLKEVLLAHRQLHDRSCAASGMEMILKCHGLIPLDDFRFQRQFGDTNIGFSRADLLISLGIDAKQQSLSIEESLDFLETETRQGRCPLVSLPVRLQLPNRLDCHIFLCGRESGELTLFDPANGQLCYSSKEDLRKHMDALYWRFPFDRTSTFLPTPSRHLKTTMADKTLPQTGSRGSSEARTSTKGPVSDEKLLLPGDRVRASHLRRCASG